jgi:hypothetical protein
MLLGGATTASPEMAVPPNPRLVAFTPVFPCAARAAEAAMATRADRDSGGEPVRLLPFTMCCVPAAALRAAALMAAEAAVTLLLRAAAAMAAAVARGASAANATADTRVVVLTCTENSDKTRMVSSTEPSAAVDTTGMTVMFEGEMPPASLRKLSVAADSTLARTALMTDASALPGGSEKVNVCDNGAEMI